MDNEEIHVIKMMTNWSWIEMCGPGGLVPWYPSKHDIGSCFQHIFLLVPVLILFAVVSAYFYGSSPEQSAIRNQKCIIHLRFTVTLLIAVIPVAKFIVGRWYTTGMFRPVDYLTSGVEIIAWSVHAGYVHSLRHNAKIHGPVVVRVLWTLLVVLAVINLRTEVINKPTDQSTVHSIKFGFCVTFVVLQIFYGLTFLFNGRRQYPTLLSTNSQFSEHSHLLSPSVYQGFREDFDPEYLGVAMDGETFTSKLIFYWVNSLMKKGSDGKLKTCDDLYDLPNELSCSYVCEKLHAALNSVKKPETTYGSTEVAILPEPEKVTLFKALHMCFGVEFYSIGVLKLLSDIFGFGGPLLLHRLVNFIENKDDPVENGYLCAFGLFLTTFFGALSNVHFNFLMAKIGIKLRGALISTIYRKVINTNYLAINKFSMGEIANFMSTDTDRIVNSCASFHSFWSIPLQIIVSFYLLYTQVGLAFFAGVFFTIVLIPINKVVATKIGKLSTELMGKKDQRVASMTELLRGIRTIKIHVWEEYFLEKILRIRRVELKHLKGRKYLDAVCVYFWATTPILISILTFATYSLMGNQLTAATIFTSMALLNMLIAPLNAFPWILNGLTEAWVSLSRVQKLLNSKDNNFRDYFEPGPSSEKAVFALQYCSFEWQDNEISENAVDKNDETNNEKGETLVSEDEPVTSWDLEKHSVPKKHFSLENVNLIVEEGNLLGVIGPVGSGKSTLLAGLIGEIKKSDGRIAMRNIEGGCAFVSQTPWLQRGTLRENVLFGKSYDSAWYKTVLEACCLVQDLENFPNGDLVNVGEGGSSLSGGQRARVALARAVYQNKEVYLLDDVLASVDVHVARHIYNKVICGILREKTRIWCTNQVHFLTNADFIIKLDNGNVIAAGKPSEILSNFDEFANFESGSISSVKGVETVAEKTKHFVDLDGEVSETGTISAKVYKKYWLSVGHFLALTVLFSVFLMQASRNLTDLWLSFWVSQEVRLNATPYFNHDHIDENRNYYLTTYVAMAVMNTFITLLRAFLFAYSGIQAAIVIHENLLKKILNSRIVFFDITPIGRILNRFSSDTYTIDDSLPFILNILLAQFFGLLGSVIITTYGLPWLCLLLAPLVPVYHYVQATYRATSRDLKRLSSTSLSPVYCHFNETLQGLTTIRAFRSLSRFRRINEDNLENNQKAVFASQAANQWLSFWLQMIGVALVTGVGVISVLQHEFDVVDSATVGLTISYALSVTALLNGLVFSFTETEKEMISLERVGQYMDEIESEPETTGSPPYGWPNQGVIVFQSVYLKYREHNPPSLNGVSFETRPAEKIGVVGRTGAGKSSLIVALLRMVDVSSGRILIDTVNINQMNLQALRSRISVIPQDPFLFEGSIRDNVDPLGEYRDAEVWTALEKCHLKDLIENLGGLPAKVLPGGRNFSQGQRQLLCLVRAVLKNAKARVKLWVNSSFSDSRQNSLSVAFPSSIVCVDEATAFVDAESDKKIQRTIRSSFRQSTVLTIAHRISTVMDCDRILVLSDGEVIEFDSPKTLALDNTSYFYQLCQQEVDGESLFL